MNNTGIILLAFGKQGYGYAAMNLAMSIKHHGCKIPIHLLAHRGTFEGVPLVFFDSVNWIEDSFFMDGDKMNVAKAKIELINNLPFEHNIYLDVDAMAMKDLTPFIQKVVESCKPYMNDVMGSGKYGEDISYDAWAKHDYAWPFFGLEEEDIWRTIQSSWAYFRKGQFVQSLYNTLRYYLEKRYPLDQLRGNWATGQLPDELLFSGVCAKLGYDPSFEGQPIFFGNNLQKTTQQVISEHYILSMYGNGNRPNNLTRPHWQEWYSAEMFVMSEKYGVPWYKKEYVMRDKILNF